MEDHPGWRLALVLPAFNEEAGIHQAVTEADEALGRFCQQHEILIVNDGSTDATAQVLDELAVQRPNVRVLSHPRNLGYGAALRTGFQAARFDRVAFTDADGQFDLADLERLLQHTTTHPIAVGWRIDRQDPRLRCFLSQGYNLLARTLFGTRVRDLDCALKVFRREALGLLLPETPGFLVNTEMLTRARQLRLSVAEVGVHHRPRRHGHSKVSLRDVPRTLASLFPFWWTRTLFPTPASSPPAPKTARPLSIPHSPFFVLNSSFSILRSLSSPSLILPLLLTLLSACLFLTRLNAPLLEPQEPRYAEIPRQMLAEGRWLVPLLHGQPYLDKPPLLYWLVIASYRLCGVHDWAARLVPGLTGVLTVLITYFWGRRVLGERSGFLGALLLCLSAHFIYYGRMLTFDNLLTLWVTAGWAAAHTAVARPRLEWAWWLASAVACALGLLTKGPVALLLLAVPMVLYQLLDRRLARLGPLAWLAWLSLSLGLAAPWYLAVAWSQPDFFGNFFWHHHVVRFLTPFDHQEPAWFFLPGLLLGLLPWTLLLPGFCRYLTRRSLSAARRRPPALGFCVLAFLCSFALFSASGCKRPVYILPVWPPLALALGCYLDRRIARIGWSTLWQRGSALAGAIAATALALGASVAGAAGMAGVLKPGLALTLATIGTLAALTVCLKRRLSWAAGMAFTFAVLLLGVQQLQPAYNRRFALRSSLRTHSKLAATGQLPVLCYPQRWDSVSFYLPGADVKVYGHDQRARLLSDLRQRPDALLLVKVKSPAHLRDFLNELPDSVEFLPDRRSQIVTVGRIRPRTDPMRGLLAQH